MLSKFLEKVKIELSSIKIYQSEIILALAVVFISIISFQTGKIYALNQLKAPLEIRNDGANLLKNSKSDGLVNQKSQNSPTPQKTNFQTVASKNSDKYHFLWCPGASKISEANKIHFASEDEAKSRGYILAANCRK